MTKYNKVCLVCTNFGSRKDGIGHYSSHLAEELSKLGYELKVFSHQVSENRWSRFTSFHMTVNLCKALFSRTPVIVEYPFAEYNPLIVLPLFVLSIINKKVVISLHEYFRVNRFRKKIIDIIIACFPTFLVTDDEVATFLKSKGKNVFKRPIPSNIANKSEICPSKHPGRFVYFGLVNHAKAIQEMLEGWERFDEGQNFELHFITSSDISPFLHYKHVKFLHNVPDDVVDQELKEAEVIVLPIRPFVHVNNASFVAGVERGCVPLGVFGEEVKADAFISLDHYEADDFLHAFRQVARMEPSEMQKKRESLSPIISTLPTFANGAQVYHQVLNIL